MFATTNPKVAVPSHTLDYPDSGRALDYTVAVGLVLISLTLVGLRCYGIIDLYYWRCLTPLAYVVVAATLYRIHRNATHEAIRLAWLDREYDRNNVA
jgi:hypothetical protein